MSFQLSETIVEVLLERLGSDDHFRSQFESDPRSALATLGFEPAADSSVQRGIWNCMAVTQLASKEAIRDGHDALRKQLVRSTMFTPFHLQDASVIQRCA